MRWKRWTTRSDTGYRPGPSWVCVWVTKASARQPRQASSRGSWTQPRSDYSAESRSVHPEGKDGNAHVYARQDLARLGGQ
jgi:hypothetical protein